MEKQTALEILCNGIRKFRERKGLSQDELGKILDCTKSNVSNIEKMRSFPSVEGIFTLAEHGMTLEEMFGPALAQKLSKSTKDDSPLEKAQRLKAEMLELLEQLDRVSPD